MRPNSSNKALVSDKFSAMHDFSNETPYCPCNERFLISHLLAPESAYGYKQKSEPTALVHRHRRMIHPIRLQEFENICKFPILVNAPNESVH